MGAKISECILRRGAHAVVWAIGAIVVGCVGERTVWRRCRPEVVQGRGSGRKKASRKVVEVPGSVILVDARRNGRRRGVRDGRDGDEETRRKRRMEEREGAVQ